MSDGLYVGIDLGTTGVKVALFDVSGNMPAMAVRETRLDTPAPGFAEFDGLAYADHVFDCLREVLSAPGVDANAVRAIGFSSQAQTFVLLDADGVPVRPAVSWLDVRAEAEAAELTRIARDLGEGDVFTVSSLPKILWIRRHEPAVFERVQQILLLPDYLIWRLTGRSLSDIVTAASTCASSRWQGEWIDGLLEPCGLTASQMPDIVGTGSSAGRLADRVAAELGLPEHVIAVAGTNAQNTGALGAGTMRPGCASMALGTALAIVVTSATREPVPNGVMVGPHPASSSDGPDGALYTVLAYAKTAGIVLRWFRDTFAPDRSYEELFRELSEAPIGAEGLSCLPHFSGSATPEFCPSMRGAFAGLTLGHGRKHMARALVESLCFTVRENLDRLDQVSKVSELHALGGGAKSDQWLQMIADATGVPVERPVQSEAACLGAAELAMVADGAFESVADVSEALYRVDRRFEPDPAKRRAYDEARDRYRDLYAWARRD